MKITDVTLTLFGWDDIPATTYGRHTGKFGGKSKLGLLAVTTDAEWHRLWAAEAKLAQIHGISAP